MTYTREEVLDKLHRGVIMVTFNKVDGTQRVMRCTLCNDYLPKNGTFLSEVTPRAVAPNIVNVWDISENAWRSFDLTRLTGVQVL
jgi:WYL_2, Sm-like SH3 beta-barrel fold